MTPDERRGSGRLSLLQRAGPPKGCLGNRRLSRLAEDHPDHGHDDQAVDRVQAEDEFADGAGAITGFAERARDRPDQALDQDQPSDQTGHSDESTGHPGYGGDQRQQDRDQQDPVPQRAVRLEGFVFGSGVERAGAR
jgi:hypothetical protein